MLINLIWYEYVYLYIYIYIYILYQIHYLDMAAMAQSYRDLPPTSVETSKAQLQRPVSTLQQKHTKPTEKPWEHMRNTWKKNMRKKKTWETPDKDKSETLHNTWQKNSMKKYKELWKIISGDSEGKKWE